MHLGMNCAALVRERTRKPRFGGEPPHGPAAISFLRASPRAPGPTGPGLGRRTGHGHGNARLRERAGRVFVLGTGGRGPRGRQPFGSTTIVTSGVIPESTLIATL